MHAAGRGQAEARVDGEPAHDLQGGGRVLGGDGRLPVPEIDVFPSDDVRDVQTLVASRGRGEERQHLAHQQPADHGEPERLPELRAHAEQEHALVSDLAEHLTPEQRWMNDPQRPFFLDGLWHYCNVPPRFRVPEKRGHAHMALCGKGAVYDGDGHPATCLRCLRDWITW